MRFLFLLILITTYSHAGLRHLGVKNLSLDYTSPKGVGTVEKISIGMSKVIDHPVTVERIAETFVVTTPMLDFTWIEPWKFLLDVDKLTMKNLNIDANKDRLDANIPEGKFSLGGEFALKNAAVHCEGQSDLPDLENALLEICRENMKAEADRFDVPLDSLLIDVLSRFPQPQEEQPLKNFSLTVKEGKFSMYFLAQVVLKAGLRAWGEIQYEDGLKILVLRVDLIKFGYIPVTSLVMKELKDRIKDPNIKVEPPFIRVQLRN